MIRFLAICLALWSGFALAEHPLEYGEIIAVSTANSLYLSGPEPLPDGPNTIRPAASQRFRIVHPFPGFKSAVPEQVCPRCPDCICYPPSYTPPSYTPPYYPPVPPKPVKWPIFRMVGEAVSDIPAPVALRFGDAIALQDYKNRFLTADTTSDAVTLGDALTSTEIWYVMDPTTTTSCGKAVEIGAPVLLLSSRGSHLALVGEHGIGQTSTTTTAEQWLLKGPFSAFE